MLTSPAEVITVGETMAVVAPARAERLVLAEEFIVHAAGAESNVAIHLARRHHRVTWASALGLDPLGDRILAQISRESVDTAYVVRDPHRPTGVFFKDPKGHHSDVYYYRHGSAASALTAEMVERLPLGEARILHLTGITPALSGTCHQAVTRLFDIASTVPDLRVSFDVNYRRGLWKASQAAPELLTLARRAQIVFVGRDEAEVLWGTSTVDSVRALLGDVPELVVKDAGIGATTFMGDAQHFVPSPSVQVVEVIGAGDAFAAGYLDAALKAEQPARRLHSGHMLAARVLRSTSDTPEERRDT